MIIGISGKIGSGKDTVAEIIQYLILKEHIKKDTGLKDMLHRFKDLSGWEIKRFADKLKDIACLLIGCTREQLEDREFKEKELGDEWDVYAMDLGVCRRRVLSISKEVAKMSEFGYKKIQLTPRLILQLLGTECGREIIHPNIWVNSLFADYKAQSWEVFSPKNAVGLKDIYPNWIIPDTRFPNEAQAIKDRGGILIRVERFPEYLYVAKSGSSEPVKIEFDRNSQEHLDLWKAEISRQHLSETALDSFEGWNYIIQNDGSIEDLMDKVKDILIKEKIINI